MSAGWVIDLAHCAALTSVLVWSIVDMRRRRRRERAEQALFARVKAQGGWTAEDLAELERLYPTEAPP